MSSWAGMGFTTPEGYYLAYRLAFPDTLDFAELFTYHGEYRSDGAANCPPATITTPDYRTGEPVATPVGPYCSIDLAQIGGTRWRTIQVEPTPKVLDYLARRCVTVGDPSASISFKMVAHDRVGTGRVLVIAQESLIISAIWLAYIDPSSIPSPASA